MHSCKLNLYLLLQSRDGDFSSVLGEIWGWMIETMECWLVRTFKMVFQICNIEFKKKTAVCV